MSTKLPDDLQKQVVVFREWLNSQPSFPNNLDDILLARFLHSCYYDMEKTKTTIEFFFTIRSTIPDLLTNRDPDSPPMKKALSIIKIGQIKIEGNKNLWFWQLNDPGMENYDYIMDAKAFFLSMDAWLLNEEDLEEEDIAIMDVKDLTLKFLTKFHLSTARKLARYQEDAIPIRLKQIHIINAPSFIEKVYSLMKPLLKQDMTNMIHFHGAKTETLYDYVKRDDLPVELGGTNGTLEEQHNHVMSVIYKHKDRLLENNLWSAKLKDKKSKNKEQISICPEQTFRSLAID